MGSVVSGDFHVWINRVLRCINRDSGYTSTERKWFSSTINLIYSRIKRNSWNVIYSKQRLDASIVTSGICPVAYIGGCSRVAIKWTAYVQSSYRTIPFPLYTCFTGL